MKLRFLAGAVGAISAGLLIYGCLVESNRLMLEEVPIPIPDLPPSLDGFKIAVLADLHIRDEWSYRLACRAVDLAIASEPDMIVLPGDFIAWGDEVVYAYLEAALAPLVMVQGKTIATLGNHDIPDGAEPEIERILDNCGIRLLRNQTHKSAGIVWVGIDSATLGLDNAPVTMDEANTQSDRPIIVLWHEPDMVDHLPEGACLMIAGHSHGGQFTFPGGFTPMHTKLGERYPRGLYLNAPTTLYVSRGIGTTGPPSRLCCPPEVSLLTLQRASI